MLEEFTGFLNVLCSSRARSQKPQHTGVKSWASHFHGTDCWGFMYVDRETGADEWMRDFTGIMVDSWANLSALLTWDTQGNFLLAFQVELLFSEQPQYWGHTKIGYDELNRVDWYHQESSPSWLPSLRVFSLSLSLSLSLCLSVLAKVRAVLGNQTLARPHSYVVCDPQINI